VDVSLELLDVFAPEGVLRARAAAVCQQRVKQYTQRPDVRRVTAVRRASVALGSHIGGCALDGAGERICPLSRRAKVANLGRAVGANHNVLPNNRVKGLTRPGVIQAGVPWTEQVSAFAPSRAAPKSQILAAPSAPITMFCQTTMLRG